jgi:hypothetical protein
MYTVIRFLDKNGYNDMKKIGEKLNQLVPGLYGGLDQHQKPVRFSGSISDSDDWNDHVEAISDVVNRCSSVLNSVNSKNVGIQIDVAIEPEDLKEIFAKVLLFDLELMNLLVKHGISLVVSCYTPSKM